MASAQERIQLDRRAREGETVVPGGTGGKSLEAQEHLADGRSRGGQTRRDQLGSEGYSELGRMGGLSGGTYSDETATGGVLGADLDELGETVVPGGTGGKSVEAQENLAEGRSRGGETRKEQLGTEGYRALGRMGGRSS